ncbi:MAG: heavy-metal-associated domain-containing protein [SAR324 cluster bacterium]|nr:heavy-metal-associated domain-containing protein [SAR324 cluster bacterium]
MESALEEIPGVTSANADYLTGRASVAYDSKQTTPESIVAVFNTRGFYTASVASNTDGERSLQMVQREDVDTTYMSSGHMSRNMMCRSPMFGFWWNLW